MLISFVKGAPALLIKRERALVVGDLHIGMNIKLKEKGIYFQNATEKMAESVLEAYRKSGAKSLVLLGDIKESITSPKFAEYRELKLFFDAIAGIDTRVVRGNHDGGLENVLKNIGYRISVETEILMNGVALTHGNSWPTQNAMLKRYVVVGHGHYALRDNGTLEKVWLVSKVTKNSSKRYARYNKNALLVVMPSFNSLITGSALSDSVRGYLPVFKNNVFSFDAAKVYGLDGKQRGRASTLFGLGD